MIEPFCSVYTKSYRTPDREPEVARVKPCLDYDDLGENFLPREDSKAIYNPERDDTLIKELYLKRLISTYQDSYCTSDKKKSLIIDPNDLNADQFMVYFNKYYGKKAPPVPMPLDSSRRINGYSRYEYFFTGKSEYEDTIGREAYVYFKKDFDQGKSRLFRKKQEAMKCKKEEVKEEEEESPEKSERELKERICMVCCEKFSPVTVATGRCGTVQ